MGILRIVFTFAMRTVNRKWEISDATHEAFQALSARLEDEVYRSHELLSRLISTVRCGESVNPFIFWLAYVQASVAYWLSTAYIKAMKQLVCI